MFQEQRGPKLTAEGVGEDSLHGIFCKRLMPPDKDLPVLPSTASLFQPCTQHLHHPAQELLMVDGCLGSEGGGGERRSGNWATELVQVQEFCIQ